MAKVEGNELVTIVVSLPTQQLLDDVAARLTPEIGADLLLWSMESDPPRDGIDVVVPPYLRQRELIHRVASVRHRVIQSQSIGFEGVRERLPPGAVYANAAGVHETATAEFAITLLLAAQRGIVDGVLAQQREEWTHMWTAGVADRRILLLGYGGVGKAIAQRLAGFEAELVVVASRARIERGVVVHGVADLGKLVSDVDVVITSLPGGPTTARLIDEDILAALPEGALIVNVGRGSTVDTRALVDHVQRRSIRVASDVFDPEPLPAGHALWRLPGVLIAPHAGGRTLAMRPRMA